MPDWVSFSEIKLRVSIEQILRSYRVDWLRRSGTDHYRGRCPIHGGEGRDAFHVDVQRNMFHCFACGAGGNVLDFIAALEGCSIREAGLRLQQQYGSAARVVGSRQSNGWQERKLVTKKIEGNPPLSFSLALEQGHPYLVQRGLRPETVAYFGVGFCRGPGLMRGRIAIPIHNENSRLIAYCGRAVDSEAPRYLFPSGFHKSRTLFNYHRAAAAGGSPGGRRVVIVEGFFDCMRVHQAGLPCVVALMGATLSGEQKELILRRFSEVMLVLDGDRTGRGATGRVAAALRPDCTVTELNPGPGLQPDQLSVDQIRQILNSGKEGPSLIT